MKVSYRDDIKHMTHIIPAVWLTYLHKQDLNKTPYMNYS